MIRSHTSAVSAALLSLAVVGAATLVPASPAHAAPGPACPDLHILAVQGTSQSSSKAPTKVDQGMLSTVIGPVLAAQATDKSFSVDRTYVPYRANFGDRGSASDYRDSATEGLNRISQLANRIILQCPATKIVPIGYSQGGHVVDAFAAAVAGGQGSVTPDNIAFVVTFGSPTRAAGAGLFPSGTPGQVAPRELPEIGDLKPTKFADQLTVSRGQGIGPDVDQISDFGPLNGRVADFCIPGDLACSAPRSASLLRLGANIAEQSNLDFANDPTGTAARLAAAVADTAVRGTSTVINSDITGTSLADLQVNPNMSISERLSEVSAPRSLSEAIESAQPSASSSPDGSAGSGSDSGSTGRSNASAGTSAGAAMAPGQDGADNPLRAIARLGTIALNTVSTFATAMLTPENISSMVTAGVGAITASAGNPVGGAAAAASGTQLGAAALSAGLQAVPPATAVTAVKSIFTTVLNEVQHNADLPQLLFDARTWNQVAYHGGYQKSPVSSTGAPATEVTANWIVTAARAYAAHRKQQNAERPAPKPGATAPTAPYRTVKTDDGRDTTAPAGAVAVNARPATRGDHVLLAAHTTPDRTTDRTSPRGAGEAASIPVAIDNDALTEAQRVEVAADPRFVSPNQAQRLARYGTIALPSQEVTAL
jgi:hypothetical protein